MSLVVAIKDINNNSVYMGADSLITMNNDYKIIVKSANNSKIFKTVDSVIIGLVGELRDINIISTVDSWIDAEIRLRDENIDKKYMINEVIPFLKDLLQSHGRLEEEAGYHKMASSLLFAYKDQCFLICEDFALIELEDDMIFHIGSGSLISKGAGDLQEAIDSKKNIVDKIRNIMNVTIDNVNTVGYPIRIFNTLSDDELIFDK